jgi:hypothetical protein
VTPRDGEPDEKSGTFDCPADIANGMTGTLLKNLAPGAAATVHLVAFRPEPFVLELEMTPDRKDPFWVGAQEETAQRYRVKPIVPGIAGIFAKLIGKEPPLLHFWIARGKAALMVRMEGPFYADGPSWRVGGTMPRWRK